MTSQTPQPVELLVFTNPPRPLEWVGLTAILLLAAVLRLGQPGVVEFRQDEANLSLLALEMAHGRALPLASIDSSVGILQPPGSIYLLLPPYLLSSDPVLATQYIGLLNVLAVLLTYLLARRYFGPLGALVSGALYAVSPWAVVYSRKIWLADMVPLLAVLCAGTALLGFVEGRRWAQLIHLPLLALTGLVHYLNIVVAIPTLYLLFVGRRRRELWMSIPLALIVFSPFLLGPAMADLLVALRSGGLFREVDAPRALTISADALHLTSTMISGADIAQWAGDSKPQFLASLPGIVVAALPLFAVITAATGASALWLGIRALRCRDRRTPIDITLLLWLLATPLIYSVTWTPHVYTQYLVTMHTAAYLVIGVGAHDLWRGLSGNMQARRSVFALGGAALAALIVAQAWVKWALLGFVAVHPTPGGFSTPLGLYMPVRQHIVSQRPAQVLAHLDGQYIGYNEQASIWNVLLFDVPLVRFVQDGITVYPASGGLSLTNRCDLAPAQVFYLRFWPNGGSEGCFSVAPIQMGRPAYTPLPEPTASLRFANTARILGHAWNDSGCLTLYWTAEAPARGPANDFFQVAVHFFNANGEKIVDADGFFWNGRYWRSGDLIERRFCLRADQRAHVGEIEGVRIGLYTIEDSAQGRIFHGVDVLDANGTPVGQQVEIRLRKP